MVNKKRIINIYNEISEEKIDENKLNEIQSELEIILSNVKLDIPEIIELIDVLFEFNELGEKNKINNESVCLVDKIIKKDDFLDSTCYFPLYLKHILLPYNKNKCTSEYDLVMFIGEFEHIQTILNEDLNEDLKILDEYNPELCQLIYTYHACKQRCKDNLFQTIFSHIVSLFYFKLDNYDKDFELLEEITNSFINNYNDYIDYFSEVNIANNINSFNPDSEILKKEYEISEKIVNYIIDNKRMKRKCK